MAAKKETTKKKDTAKKKATPKKKSATKKVSKVTEEQIEVIKETVDETVETNHFDFEKYKNEDGVYDLRDVSEEEITDAFHSMKPEDEIFVTMATRQYYLQNEETSEPSIDITEEKVETVKEEVSENTKKSVEKKESGVKKIIKKFNQNFGYLWNGQMIDF